MSTKKRRPFRPPFLSLFYFFFYKFGNFFRFNAKNPRNFAEKQFFRPLHKGFIGAAEFFALFGDFFFVVIKGLEKNVNFAESSAFKDLTERFLGGTEIIGRWRTANGRPYGHYSLFISEAREPAPCPSSPLRSSPQKSG